MRQVASWNVRGLNQALKQWEVRYHIVKFKLSLVVFFETRVQESQARVIAHSIMPFWEWKFNYHLCGDGRIWIGYDLSIINLVPLNGFDQFLYFCVSSHLVPVLFLLSCIYARKDEVD